MKLVSLAGERMIKDVIVGPDMVLRVRGLSEDNCWAICEDGCVNTCSVLTAFNFKDDMERIRD